MGQLRRDIRPQGIEHARPLQQLQRFRAPADHHAGDGA